MKNIAIKIIECCIFISVFFIPFTIAGYMEHNYTRNTVVVNTDNEMITVKDRCGYLWDFKANDKQLKKGVKVKLKMHDNCTSNIYDDVIKDYKVI